MAKIIDYMRTDFITIHKKTPITEVFKQFVEEELEYLVVVDGTNYFVGIITEVDMIKLHNRKDLVTQGIAEDIILPTLTLNPNAFMSEAAAIIESFANIDHILVVENSTVHGVIHKYDMLRWSHTVVNS